MIQTLEQVIDRLDAIVQESVAKSSPLGYFAALYKRVTIEVRDAIERGEFEDPLRMEKLDILFANRYIDAYEARQEGKAHSDSWAFAFEEASDRKLTTLQHLMLGMNAHISLDLGIAAAQAGHSDPLSLKKDFCHINTILESLIDDTQKRLTRMFRLFGLADRLLGPIDETLSIFSIGYARDKAWTQTLELCLLDDLKQVEHIKARDKAVANFARHISHPPSRLARIILFFVRVFGKGSIKDRILILDKTSQ
ncbi:DUF5995 family protein [Pelagicoccus albus]|uniref:Uncharacterized protein n=1 Tax=Pelagicoccus albus TaxID=415222 RepID=A0A7X1B463_9BACT|nr:DUF5995 family protein [Pelagicoccus albus]MBC2605305.1 hypothetical protein [Pelagicoccus albus]